MYKVDKTDIEPATEALLRKRSLDTVLDTYLKQLDKKLKSTDDCDALLKKVKEDQSKFNNALNVMMDAKVKYDKGTIDKSQFKTLTRDAYKDGAFIGGIGGKASSAGVNLGDEITQVNGIPVSNWSDIC